MENEVANAANEANLLIAWVVLSGLAFVAMFALIQANKFYDMCYRGFHWSKDVVSAKYDVPDFHEDMVVLSNKSKTVPPRALLVMLINIILLYSVKIGEVSTMMTILAAGVNAHLMVTVYSTSVKMGQITRFIGAVETEAVLREMKRKEVKKEEENE